MEFASESVEGVRFGFMSDEEVKRLSFKKITNPLFLDPIGGPVSGGLYDPSLGPMDESANCKSCGQRYYNCPGHFGHIDLVSVVYNPLLFGTLVNILRRTCFFCLQFTSNEEEVKNCVMRLKLIVKGDIVGAKELELDVKSPSLSTSKLSGSSDKQEWTSLQLNEARSVLHEFLTFKSRKCKRCAAKNPSLKKPTFGWIHMSGMSDATIRANVIKGHKIGHALADGDDDKSAASEVDNNDDPVSGGVDISTGRGTSSFATPGEVKKRKKKEEPLTEFLEHKNIFAGSLLPSTVKEILRVLWEKEGELCSFICDIQQQPHSRTQNAGYSMFFLKRLLVPPIKFRPPAKQADSVMEHPHTVLLGKIIESNAALGNARERNVEHRAVLGRWMSLQQAINIYFDSKTAVGQSQKSSSTGICQLLEKKEGVFRQKMMGKRVNYACRSVISPDPYLAVNEIGIPPAFALKLTYPERVTPWNVMKLRDAVVNGPENHPGATTYIDKLTSIKLLGKNTRIAIARKLSSSRGAVTEAGKMSENDFEGKIVLRHIRDGDAVLANRQPTLHKPSICGFFARVLPGEKTIRMHYVNCDSFNADFDGDEINVHLPQDEVSRAEAYNIVNADYQYIVPTRGDPKRALIQDHIVSAVLLTKRDTFLTREEFNQLLYSSGLSSAGALSANVKPGRKVSIINTEDFVSLLPPAILRPQPLWTGKQVMTAILNHLTHGEPFTVKKRGKIAREYFGKDDSKRKGDQISKKRIRIGNPTESMDEDVVFVHKNELVQGVIDKEQFGKYGLVHTVQELFGSNVAGTLLSVLSRVLTAFLQFHGFTCGVDDLLLFQDYEQQRKQLLDICQHCGEEVHKQFVGSEEKKIDSIDMQVEIEKAILRNGDSAIALLDAMMRNKLNSCSSALGKLFPGGLTKPFRRNCLSLMTLSGAKGGTFNFQQISLLLGQQELEGKRVPRMVSGKTLPCFPPWDTSSRAGGFIGDRYLSGLCPQEFYFHCMAGREGLVDTAVKTSRSGYLQRCLVKNLESLRVHYDYTVRDADGSVVQFYYGEDGVDVHKKNFIEEFEALALNRKIVQNRLFGKTDDVCISKFIEDNQYPSVLAKKAEDFLMDERKATRCGIRRKEHRSFIKLLKSKFFLSLAEPGEPVGVIAAQSIGEPSTQMTLNTFHHAGRGEMNVTLGIPRLQEIIMTASSFIRTPTMTCPLLRDKSSDDAEWLAAKMRKVSVADLLEDIEVCVVPLTISKHDVYTLCKLQMKLYGPESYPLHTDISLEDCKETLEGMFMRQLEDAIDRHMTLLSKINDIAHFTSKSEIDASNDADDNDEGDKLQGKDAGSDGDDASEEGADDLGLDVKKSKQQATDEMDYEDASDNEQGGLPTERNNSEGDQSDHEEDDDDDDDDVVPSNHDESPVVALTKDLKDETPLPLKSRQSPGKYKSSAEQNKSESGRLEKKTDRAIYVDCDGRHFEAHFRFSVNDPHIMLTQIVQRTAKKVAIKSPGDIDQCKVVEIHLDDSGSSKSGGIPMLRKGKESRIALQTAGVDFSAFWELKDDLDVNYISSNSVDAVLRTYGIEAARATIITEIFRVFNHYGVSVDMRHLMLVADFMTHTGEYRSMNRVGGIAESNSPFARMCFETASKFIVEAATQSEKDDLETPSARVCLGLPAKVGTGCFDLLHELGF